MLQVALPDADLQRSIDRLERARRERRWREFVSEQCALIPDLNRATDLVRMSWFELSPETQERTVVLRKEVDRWLKRIEQPKSFAERLGRWLSVFWFLAHETELLQCIIAQARLVATIDQALATEARRRRLMDEAVETNQDLVNEIARGEEDFAARRVSVFTREEFRKRFGLA